MSARALRHGRDAHEQAALARAALTRAEAHAAALTKAAREAGFTGGGPSSVDGHTGDVEKHLAAAKASVEKALGALRFVSERMGGS